MSGRHSPKLHIRVYCTLLDEPQDLQLLGAYVMIACHAQREGQIVGDHMTFQCASHYDLASIVGVSSPYKFNQIMTGLFELQWVDILGPDGGKILEKFQNNSRNFLKKFPKNFTVLVRKWLKFQTPLAQIKEKNPQKVRKNTSYNIDNNKDPNLAVTKLGAEPQIEDFLSRIRTEFPRFKNLTGTAIGWARTRVEKSGYSQSQVMGALTLMIDRLDRVRTTADFHRIANSLLSKPTNPEMKDLKDRAAEDHSIGSMDFLAGILAAEADNGK